MPGILATVVGADIKPFVKDMKSVQAVAASAGAAVRRNMELGGAHSGSSGALREIAVLMREISRGNISRIPGSLSILLGQLGVLKLLAKDNTSSARVLADAWTLQSEKAALAATAAERKAAASHLAFMADAENRAETLETAVADELGAKNAHAYAVATEEKAVAAREAAAAQALEVEAAAASVGPLGIVLGLVVAIGSALFIWSKHIQAIADGMAGLKLPDLEPPDISRLSAQEEGWKKIADAIRNAKDEYNSVSAAANRYEDALKDQHELEKKLLEQRIKRGKAKPAELLDLQKKHQGEDLAAMVRRRDALQTDADAKKKQADAMHVSTSGDESANEANLKKAADAAREHLRGKKKPDGTYEGGVQDELERYQSYTKTAGGFGRSLLNVPRDLWKYGTQSGDSVRSRLSGQVNDDNAIIAKYDAFMRGKKPAAERRDQQKHLYGIAANEAGEAAKLTEQIKQQPGINARKNALAQDALANGGGHFEHAPVNDLQKVGAYTSAAHAAAASVTPGEKMVVEELKEIKTVLKGKAHHSKEKQHTMLKPLGAAEH